MIRLDNQQADRLQEILQDRPHRDAYVTIEDIAGANTRVTLRDGSVGYEERWQITASGTKWQEDDQ